MVAWSNSQEDVRLFALIGFEPVEPLDEPFERPDHFELDEALLRQSLLDQPTVTGERDPAQIVDRVGG